MKQNTLDPLHWRYAVKKFDPKKELPAEKLERLKEAFNLTATSYGLQPIRLVVLRHPELQRQLIAHSYGQPQVADASHVLVLCIENKVDHAYINAYFDRVQEVRGTSEEILEPYRRQLEKEFRRKSEEQIRTWATHQAYLALGNLLTVCAFEKIDSCPMEGFDPEAYGRLLGLEQQGLSAVLVLPVGYRSGDDPFSGFPKVRRKLDQSVVIISGDLND